MGKLFLEKGEVYFHRDNDPIEYIGPDNFFGQTTFKFRHVVYPNRLEYLTTIEVLSLNQPNAITTL